jgi:hypothetical protein
MCRLNPVPPRSKSQIQTFLEQNEGPGLQHMALKTDDIFSTMRQIRARWAVRPVVRLSWKRLMQLQLQLQHPLLASELSVACMGFW